MAKSNRAPELSGKEGALEQIDQKAQETASPAPEEKASVSDKNRLERALTHLEYLEQEFREMIADNSKISGLIRRAAASKKQQFDGDVELWPPLKTIRFVLETVQSTVDAAGN